MVMVKCCLVDGVEEENKKKVGSCRVSYYKIIYISIYVNKEIKPFFFNGCSFAVVISQCFNTDCPPILPNFAAALL